MTYPDTSAMGEDNYPDYSNDYPYAPSHTYQVPGAGSGLNLPAAEFDSIEHINWQIQQERPDQASSLGLTYGALHYRLTSIQRGIVSTYNNLGDWTSPAAKDAFRERVSTSYWDLDHIAERVEDIRRGLYDLARVMRTAKTDMQDLYDDYEETKGRWETALALDQEENADRMRRTAGGSNHNPTTSKWPKTIAVEQESTVGQVNDAGGSLLSTPPSWDAYKAKWDEKAQEKLDEIRKTYTEPVTKLGGNLPLLRVLDSRPHPRAFKSDFEWPPGGTPGAGPAPGAPPPTGAAPGAPAGGGDVPGGPAPDGPPVGAGNPSLMNILYDPSAGGGPASEVGDIPADPNAPAAPDVPGGSDAPGLSDVDAAPGLDAGSTGAGPAPVGPGLTMMNLGGPGSSSSTQGSQSTAPSLLNGSPNPETFSAGTLNSTLDPYASVTPQPPDSVITSPGSSEFTGSAPGMSTLSADGPPGAGTGMPPGMGMPPGTRMPGMGGPPGAQNRQQPQRPGEGANQRGPGAPGLPAMPGMPGRAGGMPPGVGMPPGAGTPGGNQRGEQPGQPGAPGGPTAVPQAFAPPMTGAPPVLGNPQQRRDQRQPGSSGESPRTARGARTNGAGGGGGTPPILTNQRSAGPRRTYTEQRDANRQARRERARRFAEVLKSQFAKDVPTGTAPVLEGRAPAEAGAARVTEVPAALRARQPVPADRHARPDQPADRTTRRVVPEPAPATPEQSVTDRDAWEVETPGGPVVAGEKKKRRKDSPPALGAKD